MKNARKFIFLFLLTTSVVFGQQTVTGNKLQIGSGASSIAGNITFGGSANIGGVEILSDTAVISYHRPTEDTNAARGTAILAAAAAATSGQTIRVGPGTFSLVNDVLVLADGVNLSMDPATVITSDHDNFLGVDAVILAPGTGSVITGGTLQGTGQVGAYQAPIGVFSGAAKTGVKVIGTKFIADTDGLYIVIAGSTFELWNCVFEQKYDSIVSSGAATMVTCHSCKITIAGPSLAGTGESRGIQALAGGGIRYYGGSITVNDGGNDTNACVRTTGANSTIELHDVALRQSNASEPLASNFDILVLATGSPSVKVFGGSGSNTDGSYMTSGTVVLNSETFSKVGVGLSGTDAVTNLTVGDTVTTSPRGIMSWQSNTGTDGARLHLRKSRGSFSGPTTVLTGDTLGRLIASGFVGATNGFIEMASIDMKAAGTVADTSTGRLPTDMEFWTATNASPSVLTKRLTIDSAGLSTFTGGVSCTTLSASGVVTLSSTLGMGGTAITFGALPSGATTAGALATYAAQTYTVTGTNTATAFQAIYHGVPTFTDASAGTVTDLFSEVWAGPAAVAGSLVGTRKHTLGIVDSTAATSPITGALVVAATLGTQATSVGIGGGNIQAGGSILANGDINAGSGRAIYWGGGASMISSVNSKIKTGSNNGTTGVTWDYSTDGTAKLRNYADNADGNLTAAAGTFSGVIGLANGSVTSPAVAPTSDPDTGFYWTNSGYWDFTSNGVAATEFGSRGDNIRLGSTGTIGFVSNVSPLIGSADTNLSRISAGVIGIGTGAPGSTAGGISTATGTFSGSVSVVPGTAADTAKVGGVLSTITTGVGNNGAGEDDLITYSVPANSLAVDGDYIEFSGAGVIASSVNAKRVKIYFGAAVIFDTGAAGIPISAAIDFTVTGKIFRTGAATQKCMCHMNTNNATLASYADYSTAAETLSGAVTFKATGEAVATDDVRLELLTVSWKPNNS